MGYYPLWKEWAALNPGLIKDLREKSKGKVLTDQFAKTGVSQARALTEILGETQQESTTNNKLSRSTEEQIVTVAPYFRQKLNTNNKEDLEKATTEVKEKANKLAETLGLKIDAVRTIGGTYLGSSEITYQYLIKSTDQKKVDLFASLMGDLSFEYQDAVIAANYVEKGKGNAIELTYKVPDNTTIEDIEKALKDNNIEGSSFSFETKELSIIAFSEEELNDLINKLNKIKGYEYRGTTNQNSKFLDNESRRNTYKSWLNPQLYRENRKLYNACSKALAISEAAARYPEASRESERIEAAKEAAKRWDTEFQKSINNLTVSHLLTITAHLLKM